MRDVSTGESEIKEVCKEVTVEPEKKQEESQKVCLLHVSYEQPTLRYSCKHVFVPFLIVMWACLQRGLEILTFFFNIYETNTRSKQNNYESSRYQFLLTLCLANNLHF